MINTGEGMVAPREDSAKGYFKKRVDLGSSVQEISIL